MIRLCTFIIISLLSIQCFAGTDVEENTAFLKHREAITSCLKSNKEYDECIGITLDQCTTHQVTCINEEEAVWSSILEESLGTLKKQKIDQKDLLSSQKTWEAYIEHECSFVAGEWMKRDMLLHNTEVPLCSLRHTALRAIELYGHSIDFK